MEKEPTSGTTHWPTPVRPKLSLSPSSPQETRSLLRFVTRRLRFSCSQPKSEAIKLSEPAKLPSPLLLPPSPFSRPIFQVSTKLGLPVLGHDAHTALLPEESEVFALVGVQGVTKVLAPGEEEGVWIM